MANIAAWFLAMALPLVKKVLFGLGVGFITYTGLSAIGSQITIAIQNAWGGMGASTLAILYLGGIPQSIGIILGAITARIAFISIGRIGKLNQ